MDQPGTHAFFDREIEVIPPQRDNGFAEHRDLPLLSKEASCLDNGR
ncbi:hypothetical protein ACVMB3_004495 [Sinorhizobium meliloti]